MYEIIKKVTLASDIKLLQIRSPLIAQKTKAGQFVIVRVHEKGERIPLTLADWNPTEGTITLVFVEVGLTTTLLGALEVGDKILDISGPLGTPTVIKNFGKVAVVCGGVGAATAYNIIKALKNAGNTVVSIIGARTEAQLVFENKLKQYSDKLYVSTDDGTKGQKGVASDVLKTLIENNYIFDLVYAIGPPLMMKVVVELAKSHGIKSVVSLNCIMVDGCGMCGACRITVGDQTKFACIDGPEFEGDIVDFEQLTLRLNCYRQKEIQALKNYENKLSKK
ncbi:MAG: sulfide/dihydroorotate dehydrogenase-like FAD/NAD-binding protein [Candidatus Bathyarchaeota archaeon]|nr:MAG: sulfide/dihydroorotate dehydrogenase-like FAD/NAD-binding protein [Candidatus Bathyarchaeum tardum]WNZ28947.1 MAG: sulfide/dihydroorotate dehydrogenase-like FAD/NAD-binding protein [Candidatus Bathyarchaeota archaeon]